MANKSFITLFIQGSWLPNSIRWWLMILGYRALDYHNIRLPSATVIFCRVITRKLMTNWKGYISNSTSPMDTRLDRVVAYDIKPPLKKWHQWQNSWFYIRSVKCPEWYLSVKFGVSTIFPRQYVNNTWVPSPFNAAIVASFDISIIIYFL